MSQRKLLALCWGGFASSLLSIASFIKGAAGTLLGLVVFRDIPFVLLILKAAGHVLNAGPRTGARPWGLHAEKSFCPRPLLRGRISRQSPT